jgi:hypothetical protein
MPAEGVGTAPTKATDAYQSALVAEHDTPMLRGPEVRNLGECLLESRIRDLERICRAGHAMTGVTVPAGGRRRFPLTPHSASGEMLDLFFRRQAIEPLRKRRPREDPPQPLQKLANQSHAITPPLRSNVRDCQHRSRPCGREPHGRRPRDAADRKHQLPRQPPASQDRPTVPAGPPRRRFLPDRAPMRNHSSRTQAIARSQHGELTATETRAQTETDPWRLVAPPTHLDPADRAHQAKGNRHGERSRGRPAISRHSQRRR